MADKTYMWCETCQANTPCPVIKSAGLWRWADKIDRSYRERNRQCVNCKKDFTTVEIDAVHFAGLRTIASEFESLLRTWEEIENITIDRSKKGLEWLQQQRFFLDFNLDRHNPPKNNKPNDPFQNIFENDEKVSDE